MAMRRSYSRWFPRLFQGSKFGLPHPDKADKGGEDALMLTSKIIGVADGVGGWSRRGIDAGEYSRALLDHVEKISEKSNLSQPTRILRKAYDKCRPIIGSATICLVTLQKDDSVIVTNVGDSGALIYRPSENRILFKSEEQVHDFNFPKQLGTHSDDLPEHCDACTVKTQAGDLIFVATDGVYDNLFDEDIVKRISDPMHSLEDRCRELVKAAFVLSLDPLYKSPFSAREREFLDKIPENLRPQGRSFEGGKPDDISAVLVEIVEVEEDPNAPLRSRRSGSARL